MKKKSKSSFWNKFFLSLNILAIFFLCISYLASVVNPSPYWYFSFFGLAYPFILAINILFILFWLLKRKWFALLSLIAILLGYTPLTRTFGFRTKAASSFLKDSSSLKLLTYNVHYLQKYGNKIDPDTRVDILNMLREEQPDILGIQEFFTRSKGVYNTKDSILTILKTKHCYFDPLVTNDYEASGIALFSKYPIIKKGTFLFSESNTSNRCIWADIIKNDKKFRVYVLHLASIKFQPEDYQFLNGVKKDLNNGKDVSSSKRIARKLKDAFLRRSIQVKELKQQMANCETPYIVMGDFNDTPASYTLAEMSKGLKNAFVEKGSGLGITYNGDFPNFQIDYILSTPNFTINGYKILKKAYSDHYPVTANISLAEAVK